MSAVWISLLIGLGAWTFGMLAAAKRSPGWMFASFTTCGTAAVLALYELSWRFSIGDYGGAEDVFGGILFGEAVLVGVTVAINAAALWRMRQK